MTVLDQYLQDPLGHAVLLSPTLLGKEDWSIEDIVKVITTPAFLIDERQEVLYFFRLLEENVNLMVEAKASPDGFVVAKYAINPSVESISVLLNKGRLISFPG